jgi:hypothetical protein
MHFEDVPVPGARVIAIDILGNHGELLCRTDFVQAGDRVMAGIRMPFIDQVPQLQQPAPGTLRIAQKSFNAGDFVRVDVVPQAGRPITERRNATVGGKSGARENDDFASPRAGARRLIPDAP